MSSDFRQYVNLRPFDIEPAQLYIDSIEVARTVFPDFDLRPGTIEDAIFQAFAYMSALNIGAINRLPDSLMLGVAKMIGTPYSDGTRATMDVEFTANSNSGAEVPAGTLVGYSITIDNTTVQYVFETNEPLSIAANSIGDPLPTGVVNCTSQTIGVIPQVDSPSPLNILSFSQSLYSASADGNFIQGTNAEDIDTFLSRAVTNLGSFSSALTTANQLQNYVLVEYPELITRCKVYDLTDPGGLLDVGEAQVSGKVAVFVYGPGRLLTTTEKNNLETDVINRSVAGLEIGVLDPSLLNFTVTAAILYDSAYDANEVSALVKQQLAQQFSPTYSQYVEERLRYNSVLQSIYQQSGVTHVTSLTLATSKTATVNAASVSGAAVTYTMTAPHKFIVGDIVTVSGITPSSLNISNKTITSITSTQITIASSGGASGVYSSGGTATVTYAGWDTPDGDDLTYEKKGSLLNLSEGNINLTLTAFSG